MTSNPTADCGCDDLRGISRRGLFRGAAVGGGALAATAMFGSAFMETSFAATRSAPSTIVVLSLRGAIDGMSLVVPHGDPVYYAARPGISIPVSQLLARDAFFGLHPKMAPLVPMWNAGKVAAVHATGLAVPNRSHFHAMEAVEDADPGTEERIGWLNRLIGRDTYKNPLQAIHYGSSFAPTLMKGGEPFLAASKIDLVKMTGANPARPAGRTMSMKTLWDDASGPMGAAARTAFEVIDDFAPVHATSANPANGAVYPNTDLGKALSAAARTIRGDVGAEVISIDYGSWDHHADLGNATSGLMQKMVDEFAKSLAAFFNDLGALGNKVTVVTISEFGRRTKENSNKGLDHGWGNVMLLLGAGVKGGYYGTWTPLENTANNDLAVTTDYRSVLAELVSKRLGASTAQVFPNFSPTPVGALV